MLRCLYVCEVGVDESITHKDSNSNALRAIGRNGSFSGGLRDARVSKLRLTEQNNRRSLALSGDECSDCTGQQPEYLFKLAPKLAVTSDVVQVRGTVTNLSGEVWKERHRVGVRRVYDHNGEPVRRIELRGEFSHAVVHPGQEVPFTLGIPVSSLPAGAASCELDIVHDGVRWLGDGGSIPSRLDLTQVRSSDARTDWLVFLYRSQADASKHEQKKFSILEEILHHYNFSGYHTVDKVRQLVWRTLADEPRRLPAASSATVRASCDRPGQPPLAARLFESFAFRAGVSRPNLSEPAALVSAYKALSRSGRSFFRGGCVPISVEVAGWLNGRALPRELASTPASRSMIASHEQDRTLILNPADNGEELIWWFATQILVDKEMPEALIPDTVRQILTRSPRNTDPWQTFPSISEFMRKLHSEDRNYQERYDISTEGGRGAYAFDLLMLGLENEARRVLLGKEVLEWMTSPISERFPLSPFELLLLANIGDRDIALKETTSLDSLPALRSVRQNYDWVCGEKNPDSDHSIRILGELNSSTGLGVNMKMSVSALESLNLDFASVDVEEGIIFPAGKASARRSIGRAIDLFHLNLEAVPSLVCRFASHRRTDVYRIGFALWETSVMPEQHRAGLELLDEIWAPTQYVAEIYREAGHKNVHVIGKGIDLPPVHRLSLETLGIPTDAFTFLMSFDVGSWVERKNPIAGVTAFLEAFAHSDSTYLVIKTTGLSHHPGDRSRQIDKILSAAHSDKRVILLNDNLPFSEYLGLIASVDAVVSAHRSEGFGYLPAYAMLLGVPVIVTDYSGTADFCTRQTAYPVPCKLVPVGPGDFVFDAPGAVWADIDTDALAQTMIEVRQNPEEARTRAKAGYSLIRERYSIKSVAERYQARLSAIANAAA